MLKINAQRRLVSGVTLVETMIFIVLLSILTSGSINYLYSIHISNVGLINEVNNAQNESL